MTVSLSEIVHSLRALLGFFRFVMKGLSSVEKVIAWAIAALIAPLILYFLICALVEVSQVLREEYIAWMAVLGG